MIAHTSLPVSDYGRSKTFYTKVLEPLGYSNNMEFGEAAGFNDGKNTDFWISHERTVVPMHIAFEAKSSAEVEPMKALLRVVIPVARPGIAAAAIISFLLGWAQFLFPLILTTDISTQPVTVIVAALNQQRVVPFTLLMACGVIAAAIPGLLALALNRYIVQGITAGSVK